MYMHILIHTYIFEWVKNIHILFVIIQKSHLFPSRISDYFSCRDVLVVFISKLLFFR